VGSGRTQVARALYGAEPATMGEISLEGRRINPRTPQDGLKAGIALLTEDRKSDGLVMSCSILDNVSLASLPAFSKVGFLDQKRQEERVSSKVRELDVRPPQLSRLVRTLSGGNQQKVVLARWLLTSAKVLILDEPTRGVDVATKVEIYELMNDLAKQGMAILLISSELPEILGMSDRILVMREGHLAGEFAKAEASEENVLACAAGVNT
ncbi:MAG: ATP-binding cassette domain-containing protein, partial [Rudaea sp.]